MEWSKVRSSWSLVGALGSKSKVLLFYVLCGIVEICLVVVLLRKTNFGYIGARLMIIRSQ